MVLVLGRYPLWWAKNCVHFSFDLYKTGFDQIGTDFQNWNQNLQLLKTISNPASTFHLCVEPKPRQFPVEFLELEPEFSIKVKNHTTSFHTLKLQSPTHECKEGLILVSVYTLEKIHHTPFKTLPSPWKLFFFPIFSWIFSWRELS